MHYLTLSRSLSYSAVDAAAFDLLAIRAARDALAKGDNIDNPVGYQVLAQAYQDLLQIETGLTGAERPVEIHRMRYWQLIAAMNQALTANPHLESAHRMLADLAFVNNQWDLALEHYQAVVQAVGENNENLLPLYERIAILEHRVEEARQKVQAEASAGRADPLYLARVAGESRCPLLAIQQLADLPTYAQISRPRQVTLSRAYIEVGKPEEAFRAIDVLTSQRTDMVPGQWEEILGTVRLTQGWYEEARTLWQKAMEDQTMASASSYLEGTLQLFSLGEHLNFFEQTLQSGVRQPSQSVSGHLYYGLMMMEAGRVDEAVEHLKKSLEIDPNVPFRAMPAFYLTQLTGEEVDPVRPKDYPVPQFESEEAAQQPPAQNEPATP
jgi:tetratricopeptide (TPR) repeat protein